MHSRVLPRETAHDMTTLLLAWISTWESHWASKPTKPLSPSAISLRDVILFACYGSSSLQLSLQASRPAVAYVCAQAQRLGAGTRLRHVYAWIPCTSSHTRMNEHTAHRLVDVTSADVPGGCMRLSCIALHARNLAPAYRGFPCDRNHWHLWHRSFT